ncbi:Hpt domain-containing protein [Salegentibacter salegens]|uniref:HPt (Histidine-containing phosphotransfer) domain-containing protein n=1 Tax=Salegentibacter salegens TaxID=143223 RepID=A0A1M7K5J3_9FLAO|nr:Hpt domain-containing protein [Salegentibacter salegens]PRX43121.1 HPt (histidine-containing phosphotransfer) domain-containing protein [Salegentibacter salegens]SHM60465.1 HPt (histidine-containing phosphotransfer) domain-containing protein [Salegentibacter salegens]
MSNYDLSEVKEMAGGDEDFMKIVVQTFLEEIPPDVEAMNEAITNDNPDLAYQFAHKMKPNLQLFGLELMDEIKVIEAWAKAGKKKDEVPNAASIITKKVNVASIALKRDFELE